MTGIKKIVGDLMGLENENETKNTVSVAKYDWHRMAQSEL